MKPLPTSFYTRDNVIEIARELIGTRLHVRTPSGILITEITETEAYKAPEDKASHAYNNRRTNRNEAMFAEGGRVYTYLCYGIHVLFNIVTNRRDIPHAVLIRAVKPLSYSNLGIFKNVKPKQIAGPGRLTKFLGITLHDNNQLLDPSSRIWISSAEKEISKSDITATQRVGISYAGDYVEEPWRFYLKDTPFISKP